MINFGLCNPPEPIYLYVRAGEDSASSLWYKFNIDTQQTIPVAERGLCGKLQELRLTNKEYKGKTNVKLDIVIQSDELYIVRTGIETNFAKTFLLAIAQFDVSKPLILAVAPGEETVVFARVYDATTKQRIKADWNKDANWAGIIATVQARLGQPEETQPQNRELTPHFNSANLPPNRIDREMLIDETSSLMKRKGIQSDQARHLTMTWYNVKARSLMSDAQLLDFRDRLNHWQPEMAQR
ncbi:MAG: hypothetical protein KME60_03440 [Cyanomargarita calcarea GSE-NOS-MK-12-04C]|jgi:hypothetical protein|uniref:Uncharacterized protein n=1 Tax=Cyanomargarita calcarea GSE-NOS-MK-12-04C TaxID=2839659 RepID=A0A951UT47_9CYAN|nr:hypothetical protein [Cyanomargarita calcarea GSE-NOS-MK-12-04C]